MKKEKEASGLMIFLAREFRQALRVRSGTGKIFSV
jgi:hypothetical protein